jgi:hypothetical protein
MIVPGEQTDSGYGVSTSYVITHEYGHHIANHRSNAPFDAFTYGPKYWASYEMVCDRSDRGLLAPGNEGDKYDLNPGEGWADAYAHLKYPEQGWQLTPLLAPDAGRLLPLRRTSRARGAIRASRSSAAASGVPAGRARTT